MSNEHHSPGSANGEPRVHSDVNFEPRDINTRTVLLYLFYLALSVAFAFFVSIYIFRFTTDLATKSEDTPIPVRQGFTQGLPPAPVLQGIPGNPNDPQQDLREKIQADEAANQKLEWIDKQAGIAHIPVEDAMKIIVAKGLPGATAAPAGKK
ncbi:MAG TPA: hypothetical protein VJN93_16840 [Candidatus Acidoferrum sp.]|nr:hypothetical protein [Candidatus Acidoferrum sp.]